MRQMQMRRRIGCVGRLVAVLAVLGLAAGSVSINGARGQAVIGTSSGAAEFASFPLWKDVSAKSFAVLGRGIVAGARWESFVFKGAGRGKLSGSKLPCVYVARITEYGSYSSSLDCGYLAPEKGSDVPPVYALLGGSYQKKPGGKVYGESFVAMSLSSGVRRVEIEDNSGKTIARTTSYLSRQQSEKAKVQRLRYVTFASKQDLCVKHIAGFDDTGEQLIDANVSECIS